jgi:hypothetical protein
MAPAVELVHARVQRHAGPWARPFKATRVPRGYQVEFGKGGMMENGMRDSMMQL